jgi:ribosomal-protein-alanine N-acetyltransferase
MRLPIETERLSLHPFAGTDFAALLAILSDAEVMALALYERALTLEEAREFIDRDFSKSPGEIDRLGVLRLRPDGRIIGFAGLLPCPYLPGELEFGFVLARDVQGKGYATEIGLELIRIGLQVLGRKRVYALCDPRNTASREVLSRKLGMRSVKEIATADRGPRMLFEIERSSRDDGATGAC